MELRKITGGLSRVVGDLYRVEYGALVSAGDLNVSREMQMMPRLQGYLDTFEAAVRGGGKHIMSTAFAGTVRDALSRSTGYMVQDLMTHGAVRVLVSMEVGKFDEPARDMLHGVHEYFSTLCSTLARRYFADHPALRDHVETALNDLLKESLSLCTAWLREQLTIEMDEVYTLNHYYKDTVAKVLARLEEVVVGDTADLVMEVSPFAHSTQTKPTLNITLLYFPLQLIIEGVYGSSFLIEAAMAEGRHDTWTAEAKRRITGTFVPTTEIHDGKVRYRKLDGQDVWLEYCEKEKKWYILKPADRGKKYFFSSRPDTELITGAWPAREGLVVKLTEVEPKRETCHDPLERAVKETQVRPYLALSIAPYLAPDTTCLRYAGASLVLPQGGAQGVFRHDGQVRALPVPAPPAGPSRGGDPRLRF